MALLSRLNKRLAINHTTKQSNGYPLFYNKATLHKEIKEYLLPLAMTKNVKISCCYQVLKVTIVSNNNEYC